MFLKVTLVVAVVTTAVNITNGDKSCPSKCQCSKKLTTVNCEGRKLEVVPRGIPATVERLFLGHNSIYSLKTDDFGLLPHLKELRLENNKVGSIKQYTFTGDNFPSLEYLDLRNNKIAVVEDNGFNHLTKLDKIHLENNMIQKLKPLAFNGSRSVTYINLDQNKLTSVPPLGQLRGLQSLYLQTNAITNATFPLEYTGLYNLIDIGLSNNKIRKLEASAFVSLKNSALRKLELSRNSIDTISNMTFSPLHDIQSLKLGRNPLTAIDLETALVGLQGKPLVSLNIANISLGGLLPNTTFLLLRNSTLRYLLMSNNKIQHIPERGFADLTNLLTLDLSASGLFTVLDTAFEGLNSLTTLFLNDNQLADVPKNMPKTLQFLYLNGNQLTQIPNFAFINLGKLQKLYLGANKIQMLRDHSFDGLSNLEKLHLVSNNIGTLPGALFSSLVRLISLELNKNNLKNIQINPNLFLSMSALQYLNLAENECKTIPLKIFKPLVSLSYLHLENNLLGTVIQEDNSGTLFEGLIKLITLDLSNNGITTIPDTSFKNLNFLQNLTLKSNKISSWGPRVFTMTKSLKNIHLSQNLISLVNQTSVQDFKTVSMLNMSGNPFACTCDLRWFRDWMNTTTVHLANQETYTCNSPKAWRGKPLFQFDRTKIDCIAYTLYEIIVAAVAAAVVMFVVSAVLYRKRWTLRLRIYRLKRKMKRAARQIQCDYEQLPDDVEEFDAYISCADDDWAWVTDNLLPEIDNGSYNDVPFGGTFKLFFEPRYHEGGQNVIEIIVEKMEASRLVIIVLTKNYIDKALCDVEINNMIECKYNETIEDFVIVKHSDIGSKHIPKKLRQKIKRGEYLEWKEEEAAKKNVKLELQDILSKKQPNRDANV